MKERYDSNLKGKRVAVYIDGSNLFYKLRSLSLPNITYFQYGKLAQILACDGDIVIKRYYIGVIRAKLGDKKSEKLQRGQIKLFNHLQSPKEGFSVYRGHIMKTNGVYHEKGVDVKIAVDMVADAYDDMYDTALLISSDTDLIPAIERVRKIGKHVEYIGFGHQPSYGLQKHASLTRLLISDELKGLVTERKESK